MEINQKDIQKQDAKDQDQVQELNGQEIEQVSGGVMNNPLYQGSD